MGQTKTKTVYQKHYLICIKCGRKLSLKDFVKDNRCKNGVRKTCKECHKEWYKSWYYKNKEVLSQQHAQYYKNHKLQCYAYLLKRLYNITLGKYNILLKQQNYKCAICGKPQEKDIRRLSVDHNHKTGFIRGLLCTYCNGRLLRYFHDSKKYWGGFVKYAQKALQEDKDWL